MIGALVRPTKTAMLRRLANESPREFELSARDDAIHLVGRLVTSIAQRWRMILLDDLYSLISELKKAVVFRAE